MPPRGTAEGSGQFFGQAQQLASSSGLGLDLVTCERTVITAVSSCTSAVGGSGTGTSGDFLPPAISSGAPPPGPAVAAIPTDPWYSDAHQSLATLATDVKLELDSLPGAPALAPQQPAVRASNTGSVTQFSDGLPDDSRNEWDAMLLSVLSLPHDPSPLDLMPNPPAPTASEEGTTRPIVSSPDGGGCAEGAAGPQQAEQEAEKPIGTGEVSLSRRNSSNSRRSNSKDPESVALATEQRALKKRIASRRRYADHKNRLDELRTTTQEMLETNKKLRSRLAEVQREIQLYEQAGHVPPSH